MTLNDLKEMVDALVSEGHGDKELSMDTDPSVAFDIELIPRSEYQDDWGPYIGVRTNDNH